MKIKKKMRYLALFIAAVVVFSMLPTNMLESYAETKHPFVDDVRNDQTANDGRCDYCGGAESEPQHTTSSSSSSTSTVTTTVISEESSTPGISPEEQKRLDDEAKAAKIIEFFRKNSRVRKGGVFVTSTLPGAYEASLVGGLAVTTPKDEAEKKANIKNGENLTVQTWDVNEKKSPEAYRTLLNAPLVIGGEVCSAVQININKEANGKIEKLDSSQGSVEVVVGVPEKAQNNGDEFVVAQVVEGGKTIIMADKDNDPETVTFDASYGDAAYGLIKAPIYRPNNSEHYFTLSELEADEQIYKVYNPNYSKHQFTPSER